MNNALQNPKVFKGVFLANISLWFFVIIPNIYVKGPSNFLVSLKSSSYCFLTCAILLCSMAFMFLYSMFKLQTCLLGPISLSERRQIFSNLMKDNPGLQLSLILIHGPFCNSVESLIWISIFLIFAWAKAGCTLISSRLNDNKLKNLDKFNIIIFIQILCLVLCNFFLFHNAGFWVFLLLNFESIFIFKENILAYHQISNTRTIASSTELKLEIFENILKIIQWVQVGFINGSIFSTNPIEFLLIIKLQWYFMQFLQKFKQYSKYKSSIYQFTLKYPPLGQAQIDELGDEKCCICWDLLNTGTSCRITCGHIMHVECIWGWMLRNSERKCPMCKQIFLEPEGQNNFSVFSWLNFLGRSYRTSEEDLRRLMEVFPNLSEHELLREVERAGSVQQVIDNLLGE